MLKILSVLLMVTGLSAAAEASSFVWKDKAGGFTFSFPDSWTVQTEDSPATRIRIASPIGEDLATCRIQTEKDGRLKLYPRDMLGKALNNTLDKRFWDSEAGRYDHGSITSIYTLSGDGQDVDAVGAKISFVQEGARGKMGMYASVIGTIYGDTRYVASCSSTEGTFEKYNSVFASIMSSVMLDAKYTPFATGYYRDFLADPKPYTQHSGPGTVVPMNEVSLPSGM